MVAFIITWLGLGLGMVQAQGQGVLVFPDNYNKLLTSPNPEVRIGFEVLDVTSVRDRDFTVEITLKVTVMWNDTRLTFSPSIFDALQVEDRWYGLSTQEKERIWIPELHYIKLKRQQGLVESQGIKNGIQLTTDRDARFYMDFTSVVIVSCQMNFLMFPFDSHICPFEATLGLPIEEGRLIEFPGQGWGRASVLTSLDYNIDFYEIPMETKIRRHRYFTGFYPKLSYAGFHMKLTRKPLPYLLNYYLPSGLYVMVSWTSFVIPADAYPARIGLIITTFLVLTNIETSAFSNSPNSQGINLMQVFILICIGFVFVTIVEYFYILCKMRKVSYRVRPRKKHEREAWIVSCEACCGDEPRVFDSKPLDQKYLFGLPLAFISFCSLFWTFTLVMA